MLKARNMFFLGILCISAACHHPVEETGAYVIAGECPLPGYSRGVDIQGGYAYIANDQGGLQIVSVADPESTFVAVRMSPRRTSRVFPFATRSLTSPWPPLTAA